MWVSAALEGGLRREVCSLLGGTIFPDFKRLLTPTFLCILEEIRGLMCERVSVPVVLLNHV